MSAGYFVGRVGALAVALGVGAAVSFGCSTAWAADDTSGGGSASSDSSSDSAGASGGAASSESSGSAANDGGSASSSPASQQDSSDESSDSDSDVGSAAGSSDADDSASDDAEESPSTKTADPKDASPAEADDTDVDSRGSDKTDPVEKARTVPEKVVRSAVSVPDTDVVTDTAGSDTPSDPSPAPDPVPAAQPQTVVVPTVTASPTSASTVSGSSDPLAAEPDPGVEPEAATAELAVAVASSLLGTTAPGDVPVDTPAEWVLLAAARRELADPDDTGTSNTVSVVPQSLTTSAAPDPVGDILTGAFQTITGILNTAVSIAGGTVTGALDLIGGTINLAATATSVVLNTAINVVIWGISTTANLITGALATAVNALADAFDSSPTPLGDAIAGTLTFLNNVVTTTINVLSQATTDVLTFTATGLSTAVTILSDTVVGTLNLATQAVDIALQTINQILNPDTAPTAVDDLANATEDTAALILAADLLANDTDAEGDALSISALTQGAHGTTTKAANGDITYTPAANFNGTDTFTYTVSDGTLTSTATVTVTVTPVNDAPVGVNDNATTTQGVAVTLAANTLLANDSDVDTAHSALSITAATQGAHGATVRANDGTITYTPAANFNGTDTFTYTISDGSLTNTATVTVTVTGTTPTGHAPVAAGDTATTAEDTPKTIAANTLLANDSDADNDPLSITAVGTAAHGTTSKTANGDITYTPAANFNGTDTFTYAVSDGTLTNTATVTVTVTPVNDAPTITAATVNTPAADGTVTGAVTATDPDNDTLTYTATTSTKGSVRIGPDGTFTYTPTAQARTDAAGTTGVDTDTVTVTVTDGYGGSDTQDLTVTIAPAENGNTVATTGTVTPNSYVGPNGEAYGTVTVVDPDGDAVTYAGPTSTAKGTIFIDPFDGLYVYTPRVTTRQAITAAGSTAGPDLTTDTFTVIADDGRGGTTPVTVTVDIPAYDPPVAGPPVVHTDPTTGVVRGSVAYTDPNDDPLTFSVAPAMHGTVTIDPATGALTYTPSNAARQRAAASNATALEKQDVIVVLADDGHSGAVSVGITVSVVPASNADDRAPAAGTPIINAPNATTGVVTGTVSATDPDGDQLTYELFNRGAKSYSVTVDPTSGNFVYTPGIDAGHIAASPTATADDKVDTFTVSATDSRGQSVTFDVTVPILATNAIPYVQEIFQNGYQESVDSSGVATGHVYFYDNDYRPTPDVLTYVASQPAKGSVTITNDQNTVAFTYTPNESARLQAASTTATPTDMIDTFTISADDGYGGTVTANVVVGILPTGASPNQKPTPQVNYLSYTNHDTATGATTGTFTLYDSDSTDQLTYTATDPVKGSLALDAATGVFTYTPSAETRHDAALQGSDPFDHFDFIATDGHGNATVIPVNIPTGMQNTPPVAGTATVTAPSGAMGAVTGQVTATDADHDRITYVGPATTSKGTVVVDRDTGTFTYTPTAVARSKAGGAEATAADKSETFTIVAYDNHGGYVNNLITVDISPSSAPNRAPMQTTATTVSAPDPSTGAVRGDLHITEPDGDYVIYTFTPIAGSHPDDGAFTIRDDSAYGTTGTWTFVPTDERQHEAALATDGRPDVYSFRWTATDSQGATLSGEMSVPIVPANQAPIIGSVTQTRDPSMGSTTGTFTATDRDGDHLSLSVLEAPTHGTAAVEWVGGNTYQWTYTPSADQPAGYTPYFAIFVDDGHIDPSQASSYAPAFYVAADAPSAIPVRTGVTTNKPTDDETGAIAGVVSVDNPTGGPLTYAVNGTAAKGTVTIDPSTGAYTFTPYLSARWEAAAAGTSGPQTTTFDVTVTDPSGTPKTVPITVPISPLNRPPTASYTSTSPNTTTGAVTGQFTAVDPDGDGLTYDGTTVSRLGGQVTMGSNGNFTYTPSLALRNAAAHQPGIKDFFIVEVTEDNGTVTNFRVVVPISPASLPTDNPTTPEDPSSPAPRYPSAPPDDGGTPTPAANPEEPGIPLPDLLPLLKRRTFPGTEFKEEFEGVEVTRVDATAGIVEFHYRVTVTGPEMTDPPADWYVLQVQGGRVTGADKLLPGESISFEKIVAYAYDLAGCNIYTCSWTEDYGQIVAVEPGTFPVDIAPPSPDPDPFGIKPLEDGIDAINKDYGKIACILPGLVGGAKTFTSNFPPPANWNEWAIDEAANRITPSIPDEDIEKAQRDLFKKCKDVADAQDTGISG